MPRRRLSRNDLLHGEQRENSVALDTQGADGRREVVDHEGDRRARVTGDVARPCAGRHREAVQAVDRPVRTESIGDDLVDTEIRHEFDVGARNRHHAVRMRSRLSLRMHARSYVSHGRDRR